MENLIHQLREKLIGKKIEKGTTEIDLSKFNITKDALKKAAEGF